MSAKVTIKDVAREAGVSVATVSYIMNGRSDQSISDKTKKKVLQIANLMNYVPSHAAKSLATGRNNVIGLSFSSSSMNSVFVKMIIERLGRLGYDVLYTPSSQREEDVQVKRNVDAIIAIGLSENEFRSLAENYMVPVITVDMLVHDDLFYQLYEDYPSLLVKALEAIGKEASSVVLVYDSFKNEAYQKFVTECLPFKKVISTPELTPGTLNEIKKEPVISIGSIPSLLMLPYFAHESFAAILSDEEFYLLPDDIKVLKNNASKKANMTINILLNALNRNFDIEHELKV